MDQETPLASVVIAVFNEADSLPELLRRTLQALARIPEPTELLIVDDASTDATAHVLSQAQDGVRVIRLQTNRGQLGATKAGLAAARGRIVLTLDGDLQDPPEPIPDLVRALRDDARADAIFMVKSNHGDPLWMTLGRTGYTLLQHAPGAASPPWGSGSYVAMRGTLARRVARTRATEGNLAAVLSGLGTRTSTLPYARSPRTHGPSRVGIERLIREALSSLVLTGAIATWMRILAGVSVLFAVRRRDAKPLFVTLLSLWAASRADDQRRRRLSGAD